MSQAFRSRQERCMMHGDSPVVFIVVIVVPIVVATVVVVIFVCVHALRLPDLLLCFEVDVTTDLVPSSFFTINEP